ncbi:MFS transporter [Novosphingobium sp. P6W]|uniref:MFS transporter n=1 Tax=Novosphingobium sp. P6W TaxID=1609758 RepID=UPI000698DE16|nr:MFS transporter [Novosphingobium sp. P6W]AXB79584.1 MFS transporter [Novosphingobium sp. P6W]
MMQSKEPKPLRAIGPVGAWITVATLFAAQIVSTVDRGMLALVIDPVRQDLAISEMQIAMLQGFAFSIFYVTVGLPLGAFADVVNRRRLLIAGIMVWSAATIAGGFAQGFGSMFASRLFIGVGEAVLGPCAVTMISDLFPPHRRGRPMALYVFGSMIAYGLGSLVSGVILDMAPKGAFAALPVIGLLAPWRIAFTLVGAFGLLIVVLLFLLREPARRVEQGSAADAQIKLSFVQGLGLLKARKATFLPLYGSLALFAMGGSVATGWGAVFLTRAFGYQVGIAGQGLGTSQIVWSVIGAVVAGIVVDRIGARSGAAGRMRLAGLLALAGIPCSLPILAGSGSAAMAMLGEVMLVSAIYGTTMLSVISEIAPTKVRGFAVALYAFVMTVIGGSLGPLAVAWLTENVFASPMAVGRSMATVGVSAFVVAALLAFRAAASISSDERN